MSLSRRGQVFILNLRVCGIRELRSLINLIEQDVKCERKNKLKTFDCRVFYVQKKKMNR